MKSKKSQGSGLVKVAGSVALLCAALVGAAYFNVGLAFGVTPEGTEPASEK